MQQPENLRGRVAFVTGAPRNIGRAIAVALAKEGVHIGVHARADNAGAEETAGMARDLGVNAHVAMGDLTDGPATRRIVGETADALGGVDIMIGNAAVRRQVPFLEMGENEFRTVMDVPLMGAFHTCQACIPHMLKNQWGRIVTLGGISFHTGIKGRAHVMAGKGGLMGLTRALAVEFGSKGITANSVSPGTIDTARGPSAGALPPETSDAMERPVPRKGLPAEVAAMVTHLCKPESAYITGQIIQVNGGVFLG